MANAETVSVLQAAKILGCDRATVSRWAQGWLKPAVAVEPAGRKGMRLWKAAVEVAAAVRAEQKPLDPQQERARKDRADAQLKELKLARERRELRPESEMVAEVIDHVKAARRKLLTLPRSIAMRSPRSVRTAVRQAVDDGVYDALLELSQWNGNGSAAEPICGAPTNSGHPCSRPVSDGGHCYQHRGGK